MKLRTSFATPIFRGRMLSNPEVDKVLYSLIQIKNENPEGVSKSNINSWHSHSIHGDDLFKPAISTIEFYLSESLNDNGYSFKRLTTSNAWGMHCSDGGYNAGHVHPGADWSGVIHLTTVEPKSGGRLVVSDNRTENMMADYKFIKGQQPSWAYRRIRFRPIKGFGIFFPGYVWHETEPYHSDRWALALNIKVV